MLPIALVGTEDMSVWDVDPDSLMLEGVPALRYSFEDVASPGEDDACGCSEAGYDGYMDLTAKFSTTEILAAIGSPDGNGDILLSLTGRIMDGRPFVAQDCIVLRGRR